MFVVSFEAFNSQYTAALALAYPRSFRSLKNYLFAIGLQVLPVSSLILLWFNQKYMYQASTRPKKVKNNSSIFS